MQGERRFSLPVRICNPYLVFIALAEQTTDYKSAGAEVKGCFKTVLLMVRAIEQLLSKKRNFSSLFVKIEISSEMRLQMNLQICQPVVYGRKR